MRGRVYIVGAGPGDPELITLKALRVIQEADVIVYDRLINKDILRYARPSCRLVYAGKEDGRHAIEQPAINQLLIEYSRDFDVIVRLKGGDPFVFGRGGEEALALAMRRIPFEIIPGITSAVSVPAYAGIPVTHRGIASSFAVITGHEAHDKKTHIEWEGLKSVDTLVFLMGVTNRKKIAEKLVRCGRPPNEPVAFIEKGTSPYQRVISSTLKEVAADPPEVTPPAVFIIGKVVALKDYINWFAQEMVLPEEVHDKELVFSL